MNRKIRFIFLVISLFTSNFVFSQWVCIDTIPQNTIPSGCGGYKIGISCNFLTPQCTFYYCFRESCGVHSLEAGGYRTSRDSCKTWSGSIYLGGYGSPSNSKVRYAAFKDTIFESSSSAYGQRVQRSKNGGITWKGYFGYQNNTYAPELMSVYNGRYGYGCNYSNGRFYRIDNDTCYVINNYNNPRHANFLNFLDDSVGFIVTADTLIRTTNGGNSWDTVLIDTSGFFGNIHFLDDSIGLLFKSNGSIYKTFDRGASWMNFQSNWMALNYTSCNFGVDTLISSYVESHTTYDTTFASFILRSVDGGDTWDTIPFKKGYSIGNIKMFTQDFGYIHAVRNFEDYIFRTFTGIGEKKVNQPIPEKVIERVFPNPFINKITINCAGFNDIKILDCLGKIVFSENINGETEKLIEPNLSSGIYFLNLSGNNNSETNKIICVKH